MTVPIDFTDSSAGKDQDVWIHPIPTRLHLTGGSMIHKTLLSQSLPDFKTPELNSVTKHQIWRQTQLCQIIKQWYSEEATAGQLLRHFAIWTGAMWSADYPTVNSVNYQTLHWLHGRSLQHKQERTRTQKLSPKIYLWMLKVSQSYRRRWRGEEGTSWVWASRSVHMAD